MRKSLKSLSRELRTISVAPADLNLTVHVTFEPGQGVSLINTRGEVAERGLEDDWIHILI